MANVIIGIHGLGNKPPKKVLEIWWKASIREGLKRIGKQKRFINFELGYWAHCFYKDALDLSVTDQDNPQYNDEPYVRSRVDKSNKKPSELRKKFLHNIEAGMEKLLLNEDLTINYSSINDFLIHHFFGDFEKYYKDDCVLSGKGIKAKDAVNKRLVDILKKNKNNRVLLIAHSMGSIIAYHVLTELAPEIAIDTLVTIGSPLGLPVIKNKFFAERKDKNQINFKLQTPENITSKWYNLADIKDNIALDYSLQDDYEENSRGIKVIDKEVNNDYEYNNKPNHHKSFGYLRTPEMANIIYDFFKEDKYSKFKWIKKFFKFNKEFIF